MYQRMSLSDLWSDLIVYRSLEPADASLRGLGALRSELGIAPERIPRKSEPDYAAVVAHLLRQAQAARGAGRPLERLLYIGDTRLNDGTAARNMGAHFPLRVFIGEDRSAPAQIERQGEFTFANRWSALNDWLHEIDHKGFALDEQTAVLIDVDKTAIGARGRNDKPIDQARVDAASEIARDTLGASFRRDIFRSIYDELHKSAYHWFTTDNQDYLVYIALMVSAGVYDSETLLADLSLKRLSAFPVFVNACGQGLGNGLAALRPVQQEVASNLQRGDPTPFKSFRYREYECTVSRADALPDDTPRERLLAEEITITREVTEAALELQARGTLLMGLSDKPDEASFPPAELAHRGYLPLHRVRMKVVGSDDG
jgi:hypothetical protein